MGHTGARRALAPGEGHGDGVVDQQLLHRPAGDGGEARDPGRGQRVVQFAHEALIRRRSAGPNHPVPQEAVEMPARPVHVPDLSTTVLETQRARIRGDGQDGARHRGKGAVGLGPGVAGGRPERVTQILSRNAIPHGGPAGALPRQARGHFLGDVGGPFFDPEGMESAGTSSAISLVQRAHVLHLVHHRAQRPEVVAADVVDGLGAEVDQLHFVRRRTTGPRQRHVGGPHVGQGGARQVGTDENVHDAVPVHVAHAAEIALDHLCSVIGIVVEDPPDIVGRRGCLVFVEGQVLVFGDQPGGHRGVDGAAAGERVAETDGQFLGRPASPGPAAGCLRHLLREIRENRERSLRRQAFHQLGLAPAQARVAPGVGAFPFDQFVQPGASDGGSLLARAAARPLRARHHGRGRPREAPGDAESHIVEPGTLRRLGSHHGDAIVGARPRSPDEEAALPALARAEDLVVSFIEAQRALAHAQRKRRARPPSLRVPHADAEFREAHRTRRAGDQPVAREGQPLGEARPAFEAPHETLGRAAARDQLLSVGDGDAADVQ